MRENDKILRENGIKEKIPGRINIFHELSSKG